MPYIADISTELIVTVSIIITNHHGNMQINGCLPESKNLELLVHALLYFLDL
jgi:hypothetical protein